MCAFCVALLLSPDYQVSIDVIFSTGILRWLFSLVLDSFWELGACVTLFYAVCVFVATFDA